MLMMLWDMIVVRWLEREAVGSKMHVCQYW